MTAEPVLRHAVAVAESSAFDPDSLRGLAAACNALGMVCKDLAKYDEARALYERALAVLEQSLDASEDDIATLYHNLGGIEHSRSNFREAECFARRGLALRSRLNGTDDARAGDLIALAGILDGQRRFGEAEVMYLAALAVLERAPDQNRDEIAVALNNLGANYSECGRTTEALELLARSETTKRESLGARHPDLAMTLNNLAVARRRSGDLAGARPLYDAALEIFNNTLGADHPKTVACRGNLSTLENLRMSAQSESLSEHEIVRIDLTAEQRQIVKTATSRDASAIELTIDELEQRIVPGSVNPTGPADFFRLAGNHNETLLVDDA